MMRPLTRLCWVVGTAILISSVSPLARGNINLLWVPEAQTVNVGDTVQIGLLAVSDDDTDQAIGALQVILAWEPEHLTLTGELANGPYPWWMAGLPPGGLNETWADGDAIYVALRAGGEIREPVEYAEYVVEVHHTKDRDQVAEHNGVRMQRVFAPADRVTRINRAGRAVVAGGVIGDVRHPGQRITQINGAGDAVVGFERRPRQAQ